MLAEYFLMAEFDQFAPQAAHGSGIVGDIIASRRCKQPPSPNQHPPEARDHDSDDPSYPSEAGAEGCGSLDEARCSIRNGCYGHKNQMRAGYRGGFGDIDAGGVALLQ